MDPYEASSEKPLQQKTTSGVPKSARSIPQSAEKQSVSRGMKRAATKTKSIWLTLAMEALVYSSLLITYFLLVLRFLGKPLASLFRANLHLYAILALVLIVTQGVLLDLLTSFLVQRLFSNDH